MICVVSEKYIKTGFMLAGIKKAYERLGDVGDEKIIIIDPDLIDEGKAAELRKKGAILIPVSDKYSETITPEFVRRVIGGNITLEGV